MKLFISWSGPESKRLAEEFKKWIEVMLPHTESFVSTEDIKIGENWFEKLSTELEDTRVCVIFLTPHNLDSRWLHFEAGAVANSKDGAAIMPVLIDLQPPQVHEPLSKYQGALYNEEDIRKLCLSINDISKQPLEEKTIQEDFKKHWPNLKAKFDPVVTRIEQKSKLLSEGVGILTSSRDIQNTNKRIVDQAEQFFMATGSRSRDKAYLELIEKKLKDNPSLVHWRVLINKPYHQIFKDHLLKLLEMRDPRSRDIDGEQKLYIALFDNLQDEPEKFVIANEKEALVVLPSFFAVKNYDTALLIKNPEGVNGIANYVKNLFLISREFKTKPEVDQLALQNKIA